MKTNIKDARIGVYLILVAAFSAFFVGHGMGYQRAIKELSKPTIAIADKNDSSFFRIRSLANTRRYTVIFSGQFNRKYKFGAYNSTLCIDSAIADTTVYLPLYEKK